MLITADRSCAWCSSNYYQCPPELKMIAAMVNKCPEFREETAYSKEFQQGLKAKFKLETEKDERPA